MSRPPKTMRPLRMARSPMMLSMVVVLPAPLRPTRQTDSRSATAIDRLRSTWAGAREAVSRPSQRRLGGARGGVPAARARACGSGRLGAEQVGGDLRVVADLVGGAVGQDAALVHPEDPRAAGEAHGQAVSRDP